MSPTRARSLARAAALGLTLGATSACAAGGSPAAAPAGTPRTVVVPDGQPTDDEPTTEPLDQAALDRNSESSCPVGELDSCAEAAEGKSCCKGMNDCKGKGGCKTEVNDCKGMNECKGQGGCAAHCPR